MVKPIPPRSRMFTRRPALLLLPWVALFPRLLSWHNVAIHQIDAREGLQVRKKLKKWLTDWLTYFALRVFLCVVQALPIETCGQLSSWLAWLACDVFRIRHAVTEENLRNVYPHWTDEHRHRVTWRMWEHLFLLVCEIAHVPRKIHETNWRRFVKLHRRRELVGYLLDPRPLVIVSGHFGNFELASYMSGMLGFPTYAVARPMDNPHLHRYIKRFRESKGQFVLPKDGSAEKIQHVLDSGGTLALLGDQDAGPKGCWVEFLGREASCHKALAVFTLSAGAPLVVSYAVRTTGPMQFELGLEGVVDPETMDDSLGGVKPLTQWYNLMLEQMIRRTPEQYWWVHRRWKPKPKRRKRKRLAA